MATGHYVLRYNFNEVTGQKTSSWVWVADPTPTVAPTRASTTRRSAAEARRRAAALAARQKAQAAARAAAKRLAESRVARERASSLSELQQIRTERERRRRLAYTTLMDRQKQVMRDSGLLRATRADQTLSGVPPKKAVDPGDARRREEARIRLLREQAQKRQALAAGVEELPRGVNTKPQKEMYERQVRKKKALDAGATIKDIESAIADQGAAADTGGIVDAESAAKLLEKYVAEVDKIDSRYEKLSEKIIAALDAGNYAKARKLYYSDEFTQARKDFVRLRGDGADPTKDGSLVATMQQYGKAYEASVSWWKAQIKGTLASQEATLQQQIAEARRVGDDELAEELISLARVYEGETGLTGNRRRPGQRRTIQEELDHREALRRVEMERLRGAMNLEQRRLETGARIEGWVQTDAGPMEPNQAAVFKHLTALVAARGGAAPRISKSEDLTRWADEVMADWQKANPMPKRRVGANWTKDIEVWHQRRAAYEKEVYAFYQVNPPGILERTFMLPYASGALSTIQAGVSTIGTGLRVANKWAFHESKVGGYGPDFDKLPPSVRYEMEQAAQDVLDGMRDQIGTGLHGARFNPAPGMELAKQKYLQDWLASPEGQRWFNAGKAEAKAKAEAEDAAFLKAFYQSGDETGTRIDALNAYGTEPFSNGVQNLMFQLLADPTNAIPLKFTTYLARGQFAAARAGKSSFLGSTKLGRVRDFLAVEETRLRNISAAKKIQRVLGTGRGVEQVTDDILADVVGIGDKAARERAARQSLIRAGIELPEQNIQELLSLIESDLVGRIKLEKVGYKSPDQILQEKMAARDAEEKAAAQKIRDAKRERFEAAKAANEKHAADAEVARKQLRKLRGAYEVKLKAEIDELRLAGMTKAQAARAARLKLGNAPTEVPVVPKGSAPKVMTDKAVVSEVASETLSLRVRSAATKRALAEDAALPNEALKGQTPERLVQELFENENYIRAQHGGLLPTTEAYRLKGKRYEALVKRAEAGDDEALEQIALGTRQMANRYRAAREDISPGSRGERLTPTAADFLERAGVSPKNELAQKQLLLDRGTIRHLKRAAGWKRSLNDRTKYLREFVRRDGEEIRRLRGVEEGSIHLDPSGSKVDIGDDIANAATSTRGVHRAYEVFSGLPDITRRYDDITYWTRIIRSPTALKRMSHKQFVEMLDFFSNEAVEKGAVGGVALFRDGGQMFFELFHNLRRTGQMRKLENFSALVDEWLTNRGIRDSWTDEQALFGWQWKVMEERAGLPWARPYWEVEAGFLDAAARWGMHPELALSMIPNGYYALTYPGRFRLSTALLDLGENPVFKRHKPGTTTKMVQMQVTDLFVKGSGSAEEIVSFVAKRFGAFAKTFKISHRLADEFIYALAKPSTGIGIDPLARALASDEGLLGPAVAKVAADRKLSIEDAVKYVLRHPERHHLTPKTLSRPEFKPLRSALQGAYWRGELPIRNAEAHKLMLLAHLQDNPTSWLDSTQLYLHYMASINKDEAKAFIRELWRKRISALPRRYSTERLGKESWAYDADGFRYDQNATREWRMWDDLGITPSPDAVSAWSRGVARGLDETGETVTLFDDVGDEIAQLEKTERARLAKISPEDDAEALGRDMAGRRERDAAQDSVYLDYLADEDYLADLANDLLPEFRRLIAEGDYKAAYSALYKVVHAYSRTVRRVFLEGASGDELKALADSTAELRKFPEGIEVVDAIRDELGDALVAKWKSISEVFPVLMRSRPRLDTKGVSAAQAKRLKPNQGDQKALFAKQQEEAAAAAEIKAAQKLLDNPPEPAVAAAGEPLELLPEDTARISQIEELLEALGGMTEEQWWAKTKQIANVTLRNRAATAEAKRTAREIIRKIDAAQYAKKKARELDGYVSPAERKAFEKTVLAQHGKDAEELIAPGYVAPYVEDDLGVVVEEARAYRFRLLTRNDEVTVGVATPGPGHTEDFFPRELYLKMDNEISRRRQLILQKADVKTAKKRLYEPNELEPDDLSKGDPADKVRKASKVTDNDPRILKIKAEVARELGVDVAAYDEARKAVIGGFKPSLAARTLKTRAKGIAARTGGSYEEIYLALRVKEAKVEGRRQLAMLAKERVGANPDDVMDEFLAIYADTGQLRKEAPRLSLFQIRTLEAWLKGLTGIDDLADDAALAAFLAQRNMPSFTNKGALRDFLVKIGAWSPRRAETFILGEKSWSIEQQRDYFYRKYADTPDWTKEELFPDDLFDDPAVYYEFHRKYGVFDRRAEIALRMTGKNREDTARALLEGDEVLNVKQRRDLATMRRYMIEVWGTRVSKDGSTLDKLPWLMNKIEKEQYFFDRMTKGIADGLVKSGEELDALLNQMRPIVDKHWQKTIVPKIAAGMELEYADIFRLASDILEELLANPLWKRRLRDKFGDGLRMWSGFWRGLVFINPGFMVSNIADVPVKEGLTRLWARGYAHPNWAKHPADVVETARSLTLKHVGLEQESTLFRLRDRKGLDQARDPLAGTPAGRAIERFVGSVKASAEIFPAQAAKFEQAAKLRLVQDMYPEAYADNLLILKDPKLAHAQTLAFLKDEVRRAWPTAGRGPIESIFNLLIPFFSYRIKNKIFYLSEAIAHPSLFNQIEFIGRFIEDQNLKDWERDHPGEPMNPAFARRIELPWAPDHYIDLSQFSDMTRGLQPFYSSDRPQTFGGALSQWIRFSGFEASMGLFGNALGATSRVQFRPIMDANGYPTGRYERVVVPWTEPWSQNTPTLGSLFWFVDAWESVQEHGTKPWTMGDAMLLLGKMATFDAIKTPDRGSTLYEMYKMMVLRDPDGAAKWRANTPEGQYMNQWLATVSGDLQDVADSLRFQMREAKDQRRWLHAQSPEFQAAIRGGYEKISQIRARYADRMLGLSEEELRKVKAEMYFFIGEVYRTTPELSMYEVHKMSALEWSQQLADWERDKLTDDFWDLVAQKPKRADFDSTAEYRKAYEAWEHQQQVYLKMYPQVEEQIGTARTEYQRVRDQVEKEWDTILDRVAKRGEAIEAAKKVGDRERADMLYLAQELDFSLLEKEHVALYFTDADFEKLGPDPDSRRVLRDGALKVASVFLDFDARRLAAARREGREKEFLDQAFYAQGLKEVILKAKGGDPFGKFDPGVFVREMRKRSRLSELYFAKNPGKREQWAQADAYVKLIGTWGKLARAGQWDAAERAWARLPQWVKDRYYANNPGKREKAVETANYMGWVKRWVQHFEDGDSKGGMKFFWSMPKWVRERYFANNPGKRVQFEADLKFGAVLSQYFAADDAMRPAIIAANPDLAEWLAKYVSSGEARRQAILAGYRAIPSSEAWLRRVYREKYPEIFSQEAAGERRLKRVYDRLVKHPEMLPDFERWVAAIFESYNGMIQRTGTRPKELESDWSRRRGVRSRSAAEVSG